MAVAIPAPSPSLVQRKPAQPASAAPPAQASPPAPIAAAQASAKVGEVFRDCPNCPEMVVVPAGEFMMGSPESEAGRSSDEGPQHRVRIAQPFAVGRFEVTFDEWDACVAGGGCGGYRPDDNGWGRGRQPVINVSWDDAKAYVQWLNSRTGKATACRARRSGSTWRGRGRRRRSGRERPSPPTRRTMTGKTYGTGKKGEYRLQSIPVAACRRTRGACTRCWETSERVGSRTVITTAMRTRPATEVFGVQAVVRSGAWCAAAPGTSTPWLRALGDPQLARPATESTI